MNGVVTTLDNDNFKKLTALLANVMGTPVHLDRFPSNDFFCRRTEMDVRLANGIDMPVQLTATSNGNKVIALATFGDDKGFLLASRGGTRNVLFVLDFARHKELNRGVTVMQGVFNYFSKYGFIQEYLMELTVGGIVRDCFTNDGNTAELTGWTQVDTREQAAAFIGKVG
jgi:hypothetical protein